MATTGSIGASRPTEPLMEPSPVPDWGWRADYLDQLADVLERKADDLRGEVDR